MQENSGNILVSSGQAANILGVSTPTIRRLIKAGEISATFTPKGHARLRLSDVYQYQQRTERKSQVGQEMKN